MDPPRAPREQILQRLHERSAGLDLDRIEPELSEQLLPRANELGHRPRVVGRSKYTNLGRLWAALSDLQGVMWLRSRARNPGAVEEL